MARIHLRLTQENVASLLGCSQQMIEVIERGKTHGKFLMKYLILLKKNGISIDDIFKE